MYLTYPLEYLYLLGSVSVSTPLVTPLVAVSPYPLVVAAAAAPLPVSGSSYTDKVLLNLRRNVSEELLEDDGSTAIEEDLNYDDTTEEEHDIPSKTYIFCPHTKYRYGIFCNILVI